MPSGSSPPPGEADDEPQAQTATETVRAESPAPSNLPTERPTREGSNPFAGLLAEASREPPTTALERPAPSKKPPKPEPAPDTISERRVGPYQILEELGSGGMAVVYKANQPALDRLVAIKELRSEYVHDKQISTRFEREATSLATLRHTNIVHVYDYLRDQESAYIVMEHVEGIDLFDLLTEAERVPSEIAALVALQVAEGLEYAHYQGIVHRDIKPSNILVSKKGEVKLMDFGIARDPGKSELTQVGLAVGTPAYMAPEQIRGDRIDFRTDIFAFGIVLYEMLCGEKPWTEEDGRSVTVKVLDEPYTPINEHLPSCPDELVRVVNRCLQKDPAQRYRNTHELRRDLELHVQRVVPDDLRGRLVLFLRNRNFITEGEASNFVERALLDDRGLQRRDEGIALPPPTSLLKPSAIALLGGLSIVLIAVIIGVLAPFGARLAGGAPTLVPIEAATAAARQMPDETAGQPQTSPAVTSDDEPGGPRPATVADATAKFGYVKVVVDPWARVFVDREFHDLTPFARPIPLSPGEHTIGFRNEFYEPIDRVVRVKEGETEKLRIDLVPKQEPGE